MLADSFLSSVAERVYDSDKIPGALDAWAATLAFSGQIFCDFAGYSTTAIGAALCLGFAMPDNFRFPYAAVGFSDFWRRWHITLSSWLRDYLYIPLGGNRHGARRTYIALMGTMLLGGLWHGANWTFVAWGGLHGLYLAVERALRARFANYRPSPLVFVLLGLLTYTLVNVTWVFFRAKTFSKAWSRAARHGGAERRRPADPGHVQPVIGGGDRRGARADALADARAHAGVGHSACAGGGGVRGVGAHGFCDSDCAGVRKCLHLFPVLRSAATQTDGDARPDAEHRPGDRDRYARQTAADRPGVAQPVPVRPVPEQPWGRILLGVVALLALLVAGWESYWRGYGAKPGISNTYGLWAIQRQRIDTGEGNATVLVGASRVYYDIQLPVWERLDGQRPIQLSFEGTSPLTYLEDLAADPKFVGRVLVGVEPDLFFSGFEYRGGAVRLYAQGIALTVHRPAAVHAT